MSVSRDLQTRAESEKNREIHNNDWIPCEERLPEQSGLYLITVITNDKTHTKAGIDFFYDASYWNYYGGNVVAWMPLPEPWKGGNK